MDAIAEVQRRSEYGLTGWCPVVDWKLFLHILAFEQTPRYMMTTHADFQLNKNLNNM